MQKFILPHIRQAPCSTAITGQDARHIFKVLRLKAGDTISLTNGAGIDFAGRIVRCSSDKIDVKVLSSCPSKTESSIDLTLCTGVLKDKKMDWVIKHVTQLGISRWLPFYGRRSVPKHDAGRLEKRLQRWQSIAAESVKQCRRSRLPEIILPVSFEKVLDLTQDADLKIAFWEDAEEHMDRLKISTKVKRIALLIGPEGGFTKQEIDLGKSNGFNAVSLGPRILRAETAAISSCTLIQHLFGDI